MFKLGITGGLGSGKSTAAEFFQRKNAYLFDADKIAKQHLQNSVALQHKILNAFGPDLKRKSGKLDLLKLSERAFENSDVQQILNGIIWPELYILLEKEIKNAEESYPLFVVDAALIFEANYTGLFDAILLITADKEIRFRRASRRRFLTKEQIEKRMSLQMPEEEKKKMTQHVIYNNSTLDKLHSNLEIFFCKVILRDK